MKIQGNLMIGDWVLHDGKYKKVDVNWGGAVSLSDPSKTYGSIYADKHSLEEIEPIPLKKIYLTKNGFKVKDVEDTTFVFRNAYKIEVSFDGNPKDPIISLSINFVDKELWMSIEYVHELQQAMRLFGIEKTIKL